VHLRVLPAPRVPLPDEPRFHTVVRAAFAQRRKMLANALAASLGIGLAEARAATARAGIDPARRAETLTILEFASLTRQLS
jgi:16S rRNA (adenine1518-N6/adenine1519-N6)-dimethyltransferase